MHSYILKDLLLVPDRSKRTHAPLWIGRSAGDGFEERDPVEAEVQQIDQAHAEGGEQVKRFTQKMSTWKTQTSAWNQQIC